MQTVNVQEMLADGKHVSEKVVDIEIRIVQQNEINTDDGSGLIMCQLDFGWPLLSLDVPYDTIIWVGEQAIPTPGCRAQRS